MGRFTGAKIEFPELAELRRELKKFRPNLAAKHMGAALKRAGKPGETALKSEVRANQKGPTGNLLRSVTTQVRKYPKSGNAVALVGFTKAGKGKRTPTSGGVQKGKDRAFHAGFLEFGTKPRYTKGPIASSFNRLGPFKIKPIPKRGKFAGSARVQTTPKLPKAFFKRAPKGQRAFVGRTQPERPIATSFRKSQGSIRSELRAGMERAIANAAKDLANSFPPKRSVSDMGPLPF
jgi:hypothetical protein